MTEQRNCTTENPRPIFRSTNVMAAAYEVGHRFNASELARLMGRKPGEFCKKLNPDCDDRHLTLAEAVAITELANDPAILEAWAASLGKVLVTLPGGAVSDEDLLEQVLLLTATAGRFTQAVYDARADGVIEPAEQHEIEHLGMQLVEKVLGLVNAMAINVRQLPSKPSR